MQSVYCALEIWKETIGSWRVTWQSQKPVLDIFFVSLLLTETLFLALPMKLESHITLSILPTLSSKHFSIFVPLFHIILVHGKYVYISSWWDTFIYSFFHWCIKIKTFLYVQMCLSCIFLLCSVLVYLRYCKLADCNRGRPEGSFFNSYYTEV